jgi:hypothetical protein
MNPVERQDLARDGRPGGRSWPEPAWRPALFLRFEKVRRSGACMAGHRLAMAQPRLERAIDV